MSEEVKRLTFETLPEGRALIKAAAPNRPFMAEVIEWSPSHDYVWLRTYADDAIHEEWIPSGQMILAEVLASSDKECEDGSPCCLPEAFTVDTDSGEFENYARILAALVAHCNGLAWERDHLLNAVIAYGANDVNTTILCGCIAVMLPTTYDTRVVEKAVMLQDQLHERLDVI